MKSKTSKLELTPSDVAFCLLYVSRVCHLFLSSPESCNGSHLSLLKNISKVARARLYKNFVKQSRIQGMFQARDLAVIYARVGKKSFATDEYRKAVANFLGPDLVERNPEYVEGLMLSKKEIAANGGPTQAANEMYGKLADFSWRYCFNLKRSIESRANKIDEFSSDSFEVLKFAYASHLVSLEVLNEGNLNEGIAALNIDIQNLKKMARKNTSAKKNLLLWAYMEEIDKSFRPKPVKGKNTSPTRL